MSTTTSSSSSPSPPTQISYSTSPLWSDITPIPLNDAPDLPGTSLAAISYPPHYSEAMSYLRAIMAKTELSERALALTEDVIKYNPAHYTVWLYRAKIVVEGSERSEKTVEERCREELLWVERVAEESLKNYQIWHHRQTIMSKLSSPPPTEPAFLDCILLLDTKNYHVWTYRQWLVRHFSLWDSPSEFSSVESFLTRDVRNNSAWNHRWFLCFGRDETSSIPKSGGEEEEEEEEEASTTTTQIIDLDILDREIAYTSNKIHLAPQNPSPWSYLRALLEKSSSVGSTTQSDLQPFAEQYAGMLPPDNQIPETPDKSPDSNIRTTPRENVKSTHALSFLADCYLEQGKIQEAKDIWIIDLAGKWDRIRKGFWAYRAAQV